MVYKSHSGARKPTDLLDAPRAHHVGTQYIKKMHLLGRVETIYMRRISNKNANSELIDVTPKIRWC